MANVKISELPAATTPLAGTEEAPVVQGGVTKRVAVSEIGGGALPDPLEAQAINVLADDDTVALEIGSGGATAPPGDPSYIFVEADGEILIGAPSVLIETKVGFGIATASELSDATVSVRAPPPTLGPELITNGSFTGDASGWTLGANWAYGTNDVVHTPGDSAALTQAGVVETDASHHVVITVGGTVGEVDVTVGAAGSEVVPAGSGEVSFDLPAGGSGDIIAIAPSPDFDGTIDDVSVKQNIFVSALIIQADDGTPALVIDADATAGATPVSVTLDTDGNITFRPATGGFIKFQNTSDWTGTFDVENLSSDRVISFPDADGTLALLTDIIVPPVFVHAEVPTGAIDSVNTVFVLDDEALNGSEHVYLAGLRQTPGTDYTVSLNEITFTVAPTTGPLIVDYLRQ